MSTDPQNPYATPVSDPIPETSPILGTQLATLGERFTGAFIDGLVGLGVAVVIWGGLFAVGTIHAFADIGQLGLLYSIVIGLIGFAAFVAINWKFLNATGQTIGKRVAKTRIATLTGEKPQINDLILKRYALFQLIPLIPVVGGLFSLVNILFVFRKDRRCIHDLVAGTQVIKVTL